MNKSLIQMTLIVILGTFLSCNSNYDNYIVGNWTHKGETNEVYTFHKNGDYSFYFKDELNDKGRWEFSWSKLILTNTEGEEEIWRIKSLTNEELKGEIFVDFNFIIPYSLIKIKQI